MLRRRTPAGAALLSNEEDCDVIRRQSIPTNNNQSSNACTGNVKSVNISKLETDWVGDKQNGIFDNSSKKSLQSMSRFEIQQVMSVKIYTILQKNHIRLIYIYIIYIAGTCMYEY